MDRHLSLLRFVGVVVLACGIYLSIKAQPPVGHLVIAIGCAVLAFAAHRHATSHPGDIVIRRCYQGDALLTKLTAAVIVINTLAAGAVFPAATPLLTMGGAIVVMTVARRLDEPADEQSRD